MSLDIPGYDHAVPPPEGERGFVEFTVVSLSRAAGNLKTKLPEGEVRTPWLYKRDEEGVNSGEEFSCTFSPGFVRAGYDHNICYAGFNGWLKKFAAQNGWEVQIKGEGDGFKCTFSRKSGLSTPAIKPRPEFRRHPFNLPSSSPPTPSVPSGPIKEPIKGAGEFFERLEEYASKPSHTRREVTELVDALQTVFGTQLHTDKKFEGAYDVMLQKWKKLEKEWWDKRDKREGTVPPRPEVDSVLLRGIWEEYCNKRERYEPARASERGVTPKLATTTKEPPGVFSQMRHRVGGMVKKVTEGLTKKEKKIAPQSEPKSPHVRSPQPRELKKEAKIGMSEGRLDSIYKDRLNGVIKEIENFLKARQMNLRRETIQGLEGAVKDLKERQNHLKELPYLIQRANAHLELAKISISHFAVKQSPGKSETSSPSPSLTSKASRHNLPNTAPKHRREPPPVRKR